LAWLGTLPAGTRTHVPVPVLIADCHAAIDDWSGLVESVEGQNWGGLEFVRLLLRTRAFKELDQDLSATTEWAMTLKAANGELARLSTILRNAAAWNWEGEQGEVLWMIVNRYPGEKWARQALHERLAAGGQTRGLVTLLETAVGLDPADLDAKNNLAVAALLINATDKKPHRIAEEVYRAQPTNAYYASTYALSLHLQERSKEALAVFGQLQPETLEHPAVAAYYGLVLDATGDRTKAKRFLELGSKANLLPEERQLLQQSGVKL
jgi:hypothetical protein